LKRWKEGGDRKSGGKQGPEKKVRRHSNCTERDVAKKKNRSVLKENRERGSRKGNYRDKEKEGRKS